MTDFAPATTFAALVGHVIAERRKSVGMTQADLATAVGMHQSGWSKVERGLSGLSVEQLAVAANALGTKPSEILQEVDRAVDFAQAKGVRVEWTRPSNDAVAAGLMFIGAAALGGLIAAAVAGSSSNRRR